MLRAAFVSGCADYLREPWTPEELAVRAEAALGRRRECHEFSWGEARFEGDTFHGPCGSAVFPHGEAMLLRALLRRRGQLVPRAALATLLGTAAREAGSRAVDVHLSAVRRRVRSVAPGAGPFIVCVRGAGYVVP
jgi:DNA-binding response OmpR family regulator